ncbi:MAG: FxLYD domain-containing protein, partial [Clostridia bacterium]|nr:FxLYD domain-containing protein [Clostridia bacterium]
RAMQDELPVTFTILPTKVVLSVTNKSRDVANLVQYTVLFLDDDGNVVNTANGTFNPYDIDPGETVLQEATCDVPFSQAEVYIDSTTYTY